MSIVRLLIVAALVVTTSFGAGAQTSSRRIALVIGQGSYVAGELPTSVNDAGLVAKALNDHGFEIVEGKDLDLTGMRQLIQYFLDQIGKSGPDTTIVVYFSGYAAQLEGDNYLLPVDANIGKESDIAIVGFRMSDLLRSLNSASKGARIVVLDTAKSFPGIEQKTIAAGLALYEAPQDMLIAYAVAPGNVLPDVNNSVSLGQEDYGVYARALAEQIYQSGVEVNDLFKRVRLQTHEMTAGKQIPWHVYGLTKPFFFSLDNNSGSSAPTRPDVVATAEEAYSVAIETDTIKGYQDFLKLYPDHPLAKRVKILLANRREAIFWNRTVRKDTPEAYWTYLKSYPKGPHAADARRRLAMMSRSENPPDEFPVVIYRDLPPEIQIETVYEPVYIYDYREYYNYPPPPPPPSFLLPWRRPFHVRPPMRPERPGFLPIAPLPPVIHPGKDVHPPSRLAPVEPFVPGRTPPNPLPGIHGDKGKPGSPILPNSPREPGNRPFIDKDGVPPHSLNRPELPADGRPQTLPRPVPPFEPGKSNTSGDHSPQGSSQGGRPVIPDVNGQRPRPMEPTPPVGQMERPKQIERPVAPTPAPVPERPRLIEQTTPQAVQPERPKQIERPSAPAPAPVTERPRPAERPAPPVAQPERPKQIERPSAPAPTPVTERPRPIERPAPPVSQPERPKQIERPSAPAPVMEQPRPIERPSPPVAQPERPKQIEQPPRPAPVIEQPRPAPPQAPTPAPKLESPRPQNPNDKLKRPGELP